MTRAYFDIEGDALLEAVTKVHCMSVKIDGKLRRFVGHTEVRRGLRYLDKCTHIVAHNAIGYDVPALHRVFKWKPKAEVVDTLTLSCLIHADIDGGHSLEEWGKRLGVHKAGYTEWCAENGITDPFAEYCEEMGAYCDQDVEVLEVLDKHLTRSLSEWDWGTSVEMEHRFAKDFVVQGIRGVKVNVEHAVLLRQQMDDEMEAIASVVEPLLPPREGTLGQLKEVRPPKLCFKKDGTPGAATEAWFDNLQQLADGQWQGYKFGEWHNLPTPMEPDGSARAPLITSFPATLADQQHIKAWLMDMGWMPTMWSYKKAKDKNGKLRFVRGDDGQPVPTHPKFHDKGVLCPNLEAINTEFEHVAKCVRWIVVRHRRGLVESIIEALRPNGTVSATGMPLGTPTSRVTHRVVANIPKADPDVLYGKECRAMFVARPGRVMCGVDAAGLELRMLAHYVGSPELIDIVVNGVKEFKDDGSPNPKFKGIHEIHTLLWKACSPLVPSRGIQKNVTYGWLYGASDKKLGQTAGHVDGKAERVGKEIRSRMVAAVPGLDILMAKIEKAAKVGHIRAIDGRKINLRSKHSTLNTLLQSAGSILVKMAQNYMNEQIRERRLNAMQVISYHDEVQLDCTAEDAPQAGQLFIEGLQHAGTLVGIRCPLDGEVKIGKSWADTH